MKVAVILCSRNDINLTHQLVFDVLDSDIARAWASEINKNYTLHETDRFYSWPNDQRNKEYYINTINDKINIINTYYPHIITTKATLDIDQLQLNYLHKFFELLRGEVTEGTEFFKNAPTIVQNALSEFNIAIHACEEFFRHHVISPRITVTFQNATRYKLADANYSEFTFQWKFGYVYLGYCEVGKSILEVFENQDEVVGEDNIRPMCSYDAGCSIRFGNDVSDATYYKKLLAVNNWLSTQSFKFDPTKLALGLIPVAKINIDDSRLTGLTNTEIVYSLSKYLQVKSVSLYD
jgi:hypothetical protein